MKNKIYIGWKGTDCDTKDNVGIESLTLYSGSAPSNPSYKHLCLSGSTKNENLEELYFKVWYSGPYDTDYKAYVNSC